jgi:hypothetical protein
MSFDALYYPGIDTEPGDLSNLLVAYRSQVVGGDTPGDATLEVPGGDTVMPATRLARFVWDHLIRGDWIQIAARYVFDSSPLTDNRPYFAGYLRLADLPLALDRLEILQDEWGYLLLWATFAVSAVGALVLIALPVCFDWRSMLLDIPGHLRVVLYFAFLGMGYITVEVGLASKFVLAVGNYTVSAAVVITGMLVFSGLGSLLSQLWIDRACFLLPQVLAAIGALLFAQAICIDPVLGWVGTLPPLSRLFCCAGLILPPALLMGLPMPLAMTALTRQRRDRVFIWAWGINGSFSVVGAAVVPIIATSFGLNAVLMISAGAYICAVFTVRGMFPAPALRGA